MACGVTFFAVAGKDRLSSLCVDVLEGENIPGGPTILHMHVPRQR